MTLSYIRKVRTWDINPASSFYNTLQSDEIIEVNLKALAILILIVVRKIRDKGYGQRTNKFVEYSNFAHLEIDRVNAL